MSSLDSCRWIDFMADELGVDFLERTKETHFALRCPNPEHVSVFGSAKDAMHIHCVAADYHERHAMAAEDLDRAEIRCHR
jgi:hypothetical protein